MRSARILSFRGIGLALLAGLVLLGCGPDSDPLPARSVSLDSLPPAALPPTPVPRRVLVLSIDGLGAELCDKAGQGLPPTLRRLIASGCAPLTPSPSGRLADRASLITGVEAGEHGVFADARVEFPVAAPGERSWPRGPRRAPHVWAPLLSADHAVVVLGLTGDYPPTRSDRFTYIAGPVLPPLDGSGVGSIIGDSLPEQGWSGPLEFSLSDQDGRDLMWRRARRTASGAVVTPASPHPAAPRYPLAWPPMAMLEVWESGIALQTTRGPLLQASGDLAADADRRAWSAMSATDRIAAAGVAIERWDPGLLWLTIDELWGLESADLGWLEAVDTAVAGLLARWQGVVVLVSTRGRGEGGVFSMPLEPGLNYVAPGAIRVDRSLPPARQRGLLLRAGASAIALPGVSRVLSRQEIVGPMEGLAPDLQVVLMPGTRFAGQPTAETPGLVAGPLVGGRASLRSADVGRAVVQGVLNPKHIVAPAEATPVPSTR